MTTKILVASRNSLAWSKSLSDDFFAIAIFSGVGLLVSLVAIISGQQGLWL